MRDSEFWQDKNAAFLEAEMTLCGVDGGGDDGGGDDGGGEMWWGDDGGDDGEMTVVERWWQRDYTDYDSSTEMMAVAMVVVER